MSLFRKGREKERKFERSFFFFDVRIQIFEELLVVICDRSGADLRGGKMQNRRTS